MSDLEKDQLQGQENTSEPTQEVLNTPEKKSFLELAKEKIASIKQKAEAFVESGISKFNKAKESVKFNSQKFTEKAVDLDVSFELSEIQNRAKKLAEEAKAKIQALVGGKKEEGTAFVENAQEEQLETEKPKRKSKKKIFEEGEEFSPEQVIKDIRKLPREGRKAKLAEFKEKMSMQKRALAQIQALTVEAVKQNPDIDIETLRKNIEGTGAYFGMSKEQKAVAESLLQEFSEKNKKIKEVRGQYPSNKDLFKTLFGQDPKGEIEIVMRPLAFYIKIHNSDDYATAMTFDIKKRDSRVTDKAAEKIKSSSAGCFLGGVTAIDGLNDALIIENMEISSGGTLEHEEQHALQRLIDKKLEDTETEEAIRQASRSGDWNKFANLYVDREVISNKRSARDEILSFFEEGVPADFIKEIVAPLDEGSAYSFMDQSASFIGRIAEIYKEHTDEIKKSAELALTKARPRYFRSISLGVDALNQLAMIYSKTEAINILIHEPLDRWPKVVKRAMNGRKPNWATKEAITRCEVCGAAIFSIDVKFCKQCGHEIGKPKQ